MLRLLALLVMPLAVAGATFPRPVFEAEHFDLAGEYERLGAPRPTENPGKIEVLDVFWYGCPHCFGFLPYLERWQSSKPEYVELKHMPAVLRDSWEPHARAFYTAKALGIAERIHRPLFEEIHIDGHRMKSRESLAKFFARYGVSEKRFTEIYDSSETDAAVRRSIAVQNAYGITGTPTVIVNRKYRVRGGDRENMIRVMQALIEREHEAMTATK